MVEYVLITPAKNEEKNISITIDSIITQTIRPVEWAIVSDGSTDRTDDIVKSYCAKYSFIHFIRNESSAGKNFSSKVNAFNRGLACLQNNTYSYIGNLDADVSLEPYYFEKIIAIMQERPKLGIAGGHIYEVLGKKVVPMKTSSNSVAGAVQLFRRECFEGIGGYIPIKIGGIDSAAEIYARACDWDVRTFYEFKVMHQGRVLTGKNNRLLTHFQSGISRYKLGYHPMFHLITCFSRITKPPFLLGAIMFFLGYILAIYKKYEKVLPEHVIKHLRNEQTIRLRNTLFGKN